MLLRLTSPPVPTTARVHSTPQRPFPFSHPVLRLCDTVALPRVTFMRHRRTTSCYVYATPSHHLVLRLCDTAGHRRPRSCGPPQHFAFYIYETPSHHLVCYI
eukprot:1191645-Prorocentrum_minimum.AAC.3